MSTRRDSTPGHQPVSGTVTPTEDVEMLDQAGGEAESDAKGESPHEEGDTGMYQTINNLSAYLCSVTEDGEELASGFQRIPNRRTLPDYFDVIPDPIAFSTIRSKIQKKQYTAFSEFVKDVAQICHNAQVYNRPSAPIFGAAVRLQQVFRDELQKLTEKEQISAREATLPDLGELPPVEESPLRDPEAGDYDDDAEDTGDEEEDDDADDDDDGEYETDDEGGLRKRNNRKYGTTSRRDREDDADDDLQKRRGRPPMVMTPVEARISSILKGLRKFKAEDGSLLITPFEKLPDKNSVPDYYRIIANPIALDNIKKKAKRKKYRNVDELLNDLEIMFENAKSYNEDESALFIAASELQRNARVLADQEKSKSDDEFRDEDGKLPLAEVADQGQTWRVGDWVHIRNPNDLAKPIVAQIYRMWQDREGEKWINACWYYRPEQTVHRYEKHFFEHEVVKTGQYRDHQINEVVDRCFVMFVTRFNKGRPRGFPLEKDVYVCESRYNEEKFRFNKIKTWASCVPDEVRERDYEMDLFEAPRPMKKVPSPIKHLLREDAKASDPLPKPTWGSPNAPPIVGAVHRRPPEANETPPREPADRATVGSELHGSPTYQNGPNTVQQQGRDGLGDVQGRAAAQFPRLAPPQSLSQLESPQLIGAPPPATPMTSQSSHHAFVQQPQYANLGQGQMRPAQFAQSQQTSFTQSPGSAFTHAGQSMQYQSMNPTIGTNYHAGFGGRASVNQPVGQHSNMYNPPRPPEVYTLPESINEALHTNLRSQFQHDTAGKVLFFTAPPLDRTHSRVTAEGVTLGHSLRYLADRENWRSRRDMKRKERMSPDSNSTAKRANIIGILETDKVIQEATRAIGTWCHQLDDATGAWLKSVGLAHGERPGTTSAMFESQ